jgi:hypothetical protein
VKIANEQNHVKTLIKAPSKPHQKKLKEKLKTLQSSSNNKANMSRKYFKANH